MTSGNSSPNPVGPSTVRLGHGRNSRVLLRGFRLEILAPGQPPRTVRFNVPAIRIGADPACELVLSDPAVSRAHVSIEQTPRGHRLRDLESTNGTRLDGTPVRDADLVPGAILTLGMTQIRFDPDDHSVPLVPVQGDSYHGLIGRSPAMRDLFAHLELVAATPLSVILLGPTGCGKEMAARALHEASPRAGGPFVVFDCGSIDRELVGASLFGHREGAYTGAAGSRKGAFQSAHGGTLLLDEIGELPLDLQPRLLRALERREVQPLGSDQIVRVDVRVVAATHRDLEAMVAGGTFREDLLYRLAGLSLMMPPLARRREDLEPLARHILARSRPDARLTVEAMDRLESHSWPGNVRELKNVIERAAGLTRSPVIDVADIRLGTIHLGHTPPRAPAATPSPDAPAGPPVSPPPDAPPAVVPMTLHEAELLALRTALRAAGGNKSQAARLLGIARKTLREKMERYGLTSSDDRKD
ncbi:MAG: sigma 54-dependent Fis family transcriptional regulator [Candidatus Riflebacteria bacterium]|nr:sigma 54-dependent Fis family transcriptional regulator [Candidatus Riflebacteria bacterium]